MENEIQNTTQQQSAQKPQSKKKTRLEKTVDWIIIIVMIFIAIKILFMLPALAKGLLK